MKPDIRIKITTKEGAQFFWEPSLTVLLAMDRAGINPRRAKTHEIAQILKALPGANCGVIYR